MTYSWGTVILMSKRSFGHCWNRDLRLHKLVFEEDVLPDGTEVAYYARGQVLNDTGCAFIMSIFCYFSDWSDIFFTETVGGLQKGVWNCL